jgi:hypothetical protein
VKSPKRMSRFPRRRRYMWVPGRKKKKNKKNMPTVTPEENEDELLDLWETTHKRQADGRTPPGD